MSHPTRVRGLKPENHLQVWYHDPWSHPTRMRGLKPIYPSRQIHNARRTHAGAGIVDIEPTELRKMPEILKRVEAVKNFRLASIAQSTRDHVLTPSLFMDRNNPDSFIIVPRLSSENKKYIPMGFFDKKSITSDTCMAIPNGTQYYFGVLTSTMHIAWTRYVCGKFDTRSNFPNPSLADLYDPVAMPPGLTKAHQKLDKAVESAFGKTFIDVSQRVAYLFEQYQKLTANLFTEKNSTVM